MINDEKLKNSFNYRTHEYTNAVLTVNFPDLINCFVSFNCNAMTLKFLSLIKVKFYLIEIKLNSLNLLKMKMQ